MILCVNNFDRILIFIFMIAWEPMTSAWLFIQFWLLLQSYTDC